MKLIIDIPEEAKRHIDTFKGKFLCGDGYDLIQGIQNGIPLDDVKAEIETNLSWDMFDEYGNETRLHKDLMDILDSVGKESEEEI